MDRKSFLIILVTAGILAGWHFGYYAPRAKELAKRYEEVKRQQAEQKTKETPASPEAVTANPMAVPAPATQPAPAANAEPAVPEEKKTLASLAGTTEYQFTTQGGGIARGVLKEHFKDKKGGDPVVINEFGDIPIGALTEVPGQESLVKQPWKMTVDEASHIVSFERTEPVRQIKITKKFILIFSF